MYILQTKYNTSSLLVKWEQIHLFTQSLPVLVWWYALRTPILTDEDDYLSRKKRKKRKKFFIGFLKVPMLRTNIESTKCFIIISYP